MKESIKRTTECRGSVLPCQHSQHFVTSDNPIMFASGQDDDGKEIEDDFDSSSDEEAADEGGKGETHCWKLCNFSLWFTVSKRIWQSSLQ